MTKQRHIPERTCISCGAKLPKRELVRIVRTPQGTLHIDSTGKSPGRGAYRCRNVDCWQKAARKGSLERSLNASLTPQDHDLLFSSYQELMAEKTSEIKI